MKLTLLGCFPLDHVILFQWEGHLPVGAQHYLVMVTGRDGGPAALCKEIARSSERCGATGTISMLRSSVADRPPGSQCIGG